LVEGNSLAYLVFRRLDDGGEGRSELCAIGHGPLGSSWPSGCPARSAAAAADDPDAIRLVHVAFYRAGASTAGCQASFDGVGRPVRRGPRRWLGVPGPLRLDRGSAARNDSRRLGPRPGPTRSTALFQLATDLPAAVLAKTLGIHISVAVAWQRASRGDWMADAAQVSRRAPTAPTERTS